VFVVLLVWEFLTMQFPSGPVDAAWRVNAIIHGIVVIAVSLIALVGGAVAFFILSGPAKVGLLRLAVAGGIVGWPLGALFVALGASTGFPLATAAALVVAALVAYVGGRLAGGVNAA